MAARAETASSPAPAAVTPGTALPLQFVGVFHSFVPALKVPMPGGVKASE